jgi:hypothetical protein
MVSAASASAQEKRVSLRRLLWVGPLTIVAAVVANVIIRLLALALLPISPAFPPLQPAQPIFFTVIGVLGAAIVFAIVGRFARRPIRLFRIIALIALLISFLPDIGLLASNMMPGTSALSVGVLMLMHIVAFAISVGMLTRLTREP